jgi:NhaP-type Na+/H+ or K+/H+ antiporter
MTLLLVFVLALFLFSLVSRPANRSPITPPIVFTAAGAAAAFLVAELPGDSHGGVLLPVAELGLVFLLFADASHVNLSHFRKMRGLPTRLLGVGMPLTIALGVSASLVLGGLSVWEAGILAAVLAPTDAGLGQAIVSDSRVPTKIREALTVEAGLNDGLAVPFLLFFIALAGPGDAQDARLGRFVFEQLGIGTAVGLLVGRGAGWLQSSARSRGLVDEVFSKLGFLTLPVLCMLLARALDTSMFISAFVAGLALPRATGHMARHGIEFIEDWGQVINLMVFFVFGVIAATAWQDLRSAHFLYALLSLTVVRMLPVAVSLAGTGLSRASVAFIGWFGPRGLASIVLGLVYAERAAGTPHPEISHAIIATVLLSVFAHGLTARPGAARYARAIARLPADAPEHEQAALATP